MARKKNANDVSSNAGSGEVSSGVSNGTKKSTPAVKTRIKDPFANREAEKYEKPIPSREYIMELMAKIGEPVTYEYLREQMGFDDDEDQAEALRRRLIAMSRDGQLISNRRGVYGLADKMELVKGRVQGNKEGTGYFVPADASGDMFLGPQEMLKVFDGDIVLVRVSGVDRRGRKEGMIVEVLERRLTQIVGRFYRDHGFGLVVPDNRRISQEILIPEADTRNAQDGQFVVAEIRSYPDQRRKAVGAIVEILGDHMAPGMEIDVALRSHNIPHEWPKEVERAVKGLSEEVAKEDLAGRVDLRELPFVTIDGEDAKDFDDAVYCEEGPRGTAKLFVAIADVSHYVKPESALDQEAQNRGNSVYFPGSVIPMLPEVLSNGLCSLKPQVNRLVMVCEMDLSRTGKVTDFRFYEGVIFSHARMTYTEVADILETPDSPTRERSRERLREKYAALIPHLETLYGVYEKLSKARQLAGALDFSSQETRIVFGETRKIREIVPVVRNNAHRLIEECMLAANVCTAQFLAESDLPVLYRVHEGPNPDKLENLGIYLKELGLVLTKSTKPEPKDYQRVLQAVVDRPDANLIQTMLVRSMLQAVYQPDNIGHFGLGFEAYTHFTSPIRRYPDLLVHRALRYLIRSGKNKTQIRQIKGAVKLTRKEAYPYQPSDMQHFGENCSMTERRADAASYDVQDWLKCEYVKDRVGDEFRGTVSSVTGFGLFVQLSDIYVEGLVHVTALKNDYYQFDPVRQMLRGEHSGVSYRLGDTVTVKVARVDLDERKIDLQILDGGVVRAQPEGKAGARPGKSGRDGKKGFKGKEFKDKEFKGKGGKAGAKAGSAKAGGKFSAKPATSAKPGRSHKAAAADATKPPSKAKKAAVKPAKDAAAAPLKKPRSRSRSRANAKARSE
ncbi:MAG: ribonuclease R [Pseudohongiella sp.]|nr:ribonuclease R [Pseudohongiella sp.]